ncbi:MAG: nucleotidyltransferase family protein [Sphaerobacter sp.]|nr:nucleotidyltransferase family protein [Sphaerobacter sp.]
MRRVVGVILAAGTATRLGGRKQLLPLGGRAMLEHVLAAALQAPLDGRLVVLGSDADEIRTQVDLTGFQVVVNPRYPEGQSTSVIAAVEALPDDADAALFLLGDQPEVPVPVLERIVEAYRRTGAPIVQPRYAEGRGNPVLIARALFPELRRLRGDTGARPLLERYRDRIAFADAREFSRPADIDSLADYERARKRFDQRVSEAP